MQPGTGIGARAIAIIGALLFIIGFVTWLDGPLISFVQLAFTPSDVGGFLIPLALSLLVMVVGIALFGQFTMLRSYPGAFTGLFVIGGGL